MAVTVAILAGGRATRLQGRDKGLQPWRGLPLVAHVARAAREFGDPLLILANRNHAAYAAYGPVLADRQGGWLGPLAGIATALHACATPLLLTVPVDCPAPPADLCRRLCAALHAGSARAAVAHDGERRQPLFALYRAGLAASAEQALAQGFGPARWQDRIGVAEVDFHDRRAQFHNLNTPADFDGGPAREPPHD